MIGTYRLEGFAIASADGMIADETGVMPLRSSSTPTRSISRRPSNTSPQWSTAAVRRRSIRRPSAAAG